MEGAGGILAAGIPVADRRKGIRLAAAARPVVADLLGADLHPVMDRRQPMQAELDPSPRLRNLAPTSESRRSIRRSAIRPSRRNLPTRKRMPPCNIVGHSKS